MKQIIQINDNYLQMSDIGGANLQWGELHCRPKYTVVPSFKQKGLLIGRGVSFWIGFLSPGRCHRKKVLKRTFWGLKELVAVFQIIEFQKGFI